MTVYSDIRKAFETTLASITDIPDIAYENVSFNPDANNDFVLVRLFPVSRLPAVRGPDPTHEYRGFLRVWAYTPEGQGPKRATDLAQSIIDAFDATTDITEGSTVVTIDYAEMYEGRVESPWYYIPIDIGWHTFD